MADVYEEKLPSPDEWRAATFNRFGSSIRPRLPKGGQYLRLSTAAYVHGFDEIVGMVRHEPEKFIRLPNVGGKTLDAAREIFGAMGLLA